MAFVGIDDLLLAAGTQCGQRFGEGIGGDDPAAQGGTEFGELVILAGERVLAIFEDAGEAGVATLQFDADAQSKMEGFELFTGSVFSVTDGCLAKSYTQGFDTLA